MTPEPMIVMGSAEVIMKCLGSESMLANGFVLVRNREIGSKIETLR